MSTAPGSATYWAREYADIFDRYDDLRQRTDAVLSIEPEDHATKSRDYGRGFADAIRLVREALGEEA